MRVLPFFNRTARVGSGMEMLPGRVSVTARGLTETMGQPDLNVVYHFGSQRKAELEAFPAARHCLRREERSRPNSKKLDDMVRKAIEKYPPKR